MGKAYLVMDSLSYKTQFLGKNDIEHKWVVIDASNIPLGRLASLVASRMRGKHRVDFTPHMNCGDHVIVINAQKVRLSGNKWDQKTHVYHTGYPGGQKAPTYRMIFDKDPRRIIEIAVKGMLSKNRLGRAVYSNLHVYAGGEHPHQNMNPEVIEPSVF